MAGVVEDMDDAWYHPGFTLGPAVIPIHTGEGSDQVRPEKCPSKPPPMNRVPIGDYEEGGHCQIYSVVQAVEIKSRSCVKCVDFVHNVTSFGLLCGIKSFEKNHPESNYTAWAPYQRETADGMPTLDLQQADSSLPKS